MYEFLRGRAERVLPTAVVLETAGVGWFVETSLRTSARVRLGVETTLLLHVRTTEDGTRLFGFADEEERDLFRRLLKTSGVGPAHALALCSAMGPQDLWDAVAAADAKTLSAPKGVGPKLAARLIAELKDDAVDALLVLGYVESTARKAIDRARAVLGDGAKTEAVVKEALKGSH